MSDDDDTPQLSAHTYAILQEFLQEQSLKKDESDIDENWQLSQFWYDENTIEYLSQAAVSACDTNQSIALISCPTLYKSVKSKTESFQKDVKVTLFEYDKRFSIFGEDFVFYDYNTPLNLNAIQSGKFNVIVADPPFLSEECLSKTSKTIQFLSAPNAKIILCTGAVMEPLASKLLNVHKCKFKPEHKNNLGNEFLCFTNFGEI